ncbi:hypothetical protein [Streptomyces sp. NPDC101393]|uniref:hypothetical protein n=1 Tax=Streptomyces sp. NPDC101393 TaxID=3366141 RepID=UPI00380E3DBD
MATDAWQHARDAAVTLWRRVHPERVPAVEAELGEVRAELLAAREEGDVQAEEELAADWQRRLRRLLRDDPSLADELRRVLDEELNPLLAPGDQVQPGSVQMNATASGHARIYQAGGHQTIHEA